MDGKTCLRQNAPNALPMTTDTQELSSHSRTPGFTDASSSRGCLESNTFERESCLRSFHSSKIRHAPVKRVFAGLAATASSVAATAVALASQTHTSPLPMAFINPYLTTLNLQSLAGVESAVAPVQDYRWIQDCGPIVFYGGTRSAAALNSTHTLHDSCNSLTPSSSGSPPPFLLLQAACYEVEEEHELVARSDSDAFVLGSRAGEENDQGPLLSGAPSYLESCSPPTPIFSSAYCSVSGSVKDLLAPHFAGTSAYALQHADSLAEMEEFLALMDTWPTGPDFPHRDNWLLEPRDILDDEPCTPEVAQFAAESEPVFSADGYNISYRPSSLLSAASPYTLSAYPISQQAQDYFMASRDQTRNLQGCGAGISPNPFARPKGMGEHHVLPMESDVAYARFQMAADQCDLQIEDETEAEESADPHEVATCPSTLLDIETVSTPKDQQCRGVFSWIQGLFSCFGSQDSPAVGISSVAPATITTPLCVTPAMNYGTVPAVASTGLFVGRFNGEYGGNANGMIAAAMSKRKYLNWLCDGSDFV